MSLRLKAMKRQVEEAEEEIDRLESAKKKLQRELEEQLDINEQLQGQLNAVKKELRYSGLSDFTIMYHTTTHKIDLLLLLSINRGLPLTNFNFLISRKSLRDRPVKLLCIFFLYKCSPTLARVL